MKTKKLIRIFIAIMTVAMVVTVSAKSKRRKLNFGSFSLNVEKSGYFRSIKVDGETLMDLLQLFDQGKYEGRNKDSRVWQGQKEKKNAGEKLTIKKEKNAVVVRRKAILGNGQYPEMVEYTQIIVVKADGTFKVDYTIKMLKDVVYKGIAMPVIRMTIPVKVLVGKGMKIIDIKKKTVLKVLTAQYSKENFRSIRCVRLDASMGGAIFTLKALGDTQIMVTDARSWKSKYLDIRVGTKKFAWRRKNPVKKGMIKKVSFTIKLPLKKKGKVPKI